MFLMYENLIVIDEENIAGCMVLSVVELCDERVRCIWSAALGCSRMYGLSTAIYGMSICM